MPCLINSGPQMCKPIDVFLSQMNCYTTVPYSVRLCTKQLVKKPTCPYAFQLYNAHNWCTHWGQGLPKPLVM